MRRVPKYYSESFAKMANDMVQRAWGEYDRSILESWVEEFKTMLEDAFGKHHATGQ